MKVGIEKLAVWPSTMGIDMRTLVEARGASAQLVCLCDCASNLLLGGRYAAADAMMARLAQVAPNPTVLEAPVAAALSQLLALRALFAGDPGASLERFEAALAALESAGDRRNACTVRTNLGVTFCACSRSCCNP